MSDTYYKLSVEVHEGIVDFARALTPYPLAKQRYKPHITVVRKEVPIHLALWGAREGEVVEFEYETWVYDDGVYFWLRAYSTALTAIRRELGLPADSRYTRGPDGMRAYHITIGNLKGSK